MERTSVVKDFKIIGLDLSSVIQIGDSEEISSYSRVIAIQREKQLFYSDELNFSDYAIFLRNKPIVPEKSKVCMITTNKHPYIKIGKMNVLTTSTTSIIHIGNSKRVLMESRTKNIRHLNKEKKR